MKKQIAPFVKAHLIRGAFYLLLLVAVSVIPFALGQRSTAKQSTAANRTHIGEHMHRANVSPAAPAGGVYEAWVARYNGPGNNYDEARAIGIDNSGNVYVGGYSWGSGTRTDYTTIKYNSTGNEEWVARYNGPVNGDDQLSAMAVDASGNVYVTGASSLANSRLECTTIKYNSAGQEQWIGHYSGPGDVTAGDAIAVDGSGNVYVAADASIPNDANTRFSVTIKYNGGLQRTTAE
jgi:hypothetical protein